MSWYPRTTPWSDHCWLKYIQICYCFRCGFLENQADCLKDRCECSAVRCHRYSAAGWFQSKAWARFTCWKPKCGWCNKSKTSASVWPGYPDTEKQMKARGRRPSAFIVSRCLEIPVKHDARVFDMASKTIHTSLVIEGVLFQCSDFPWDYVFKKQSKCGKFVVVRCKSCGSEDGGVCCSECRTPFSFSKNLGRRIKVAEREYS